MSSASQALKQTLDEHGSARCRARRARRSRRRRTPGRRTPPGRVGRSERPLPRGSTVTTRKCRDEVGHLRLPHPAVHDRVHGREHDRRLALAERLVGDLTPSRSTYPARPAPVPACPLAPSVDTPHANRGRVAAPLQRRLQGGCEQRGPGPASTRMHRTRETQMTTDQTTDQTAAPLDMDVLMEFVGQFVGDLGATIAAGNVLVGERLGLYRGARRRARPTPARWPRRPAPTRATSRSGCAARPPAATSSTTPPPATYSMTPEQAFALTDPTGPVFLPGAFELALGALKAEPRIEEAFRTGAGIGWHEHDARGLHRLRAVLPARLPDAPAARVDPGARRRAGASSSEGATVADLGCGHGASHAADGRGVPEQPVHRLRLPRGLDRGGPRARGRGRRRGPGRVRGRPAPRRSRRTASTW